LLSGRQSVALWACFVLGGLVVAAVGRLHGSPTPVAFLADPANAAIAVLDPPRAPAIADDPELLAIAAESGLDPMLVMAVILAESGQDPAALSSRGAVGLMQVMPETAAWLGFPEFADPATNLRAGCTYLRQLLDMFGNDVELALAAYNAGPGAVRRWGTVPRYRETQAFIKKVSEEYTRLTGTDLITSQALARSSV
jgi:soluble lytic murein transglycosylase-like protein